MKKGQVYFIQSGVGGPIKIGFTTKLENRLASLQAANPQRLVVLAAALGGKDIERAVHRRFQAIALGSEWFEPHADLLSLIERVKNEGDRLLLTTFSRSAVQAARVTLESRGADPRLFTHVETADMMRDWLMALAEPRPVGDTMKLAIERAAQRSGLPVGRVKSVWYREARVIEAFEYLQVQSAISTADQLSIFQNVPPSGPGGSMHRSSAAVDSKQRG